MAATFLPGMEGVLQSQHWRWLIDIFGGAVGVCGAIAGSFFWIGMLIHCMVTKSLSTFSKLLWIIALLFATIVAALFYYFLIYAPKVECNNSVTC
jgi:hypothetical protein